MISTPLMQMHVLTVRLALTLAQLELSRQSSSCTHQAPANHDFKHVAGVHTKLSFWGSFFCGVFPCGSGFAGVSRFAPAYAALPIPNTPHTSPLPPTPRHPVACRRAKGSPAGATTLRHRSGLLARLKRRQSSRPGAETLQLVTRQIALAPIGMFRKITC